MGRAVIGGLITSTLLTLYVVPVVYALLDDFMNRLRHGWAARGAVGPPPAPGPRARGRRGGLRAGAARERRWLDG